MLYKFDEFWKTLFFFIAVWIGYGICGYEFAVVSLLAGIYLRLKKQGLFTTVMKITKETLKQLIKEEL